VNVALITIHGVIAAASGSLAVTAELTHNVVDLATAAMVVVGLKLATHRSDVFPYGLYKVENLVAAALAVMIFLTAYEIAGKVFLGTAGTPHVDGWMLVLLVVTLTIPLVFSHYEMRAARDSNSPALMADAREYRVHAYTTGLALVALASTRVSFPLDRIAAFVIVLAVAKTGWDLLTDALRVLLDASLDAKALGAIRHVIEGDSAVAGVQWITGRNAGRFRFAEAGITLRRIGLGRAEIAVERIEAAVRNAVPQVERVLLHIEARPSTHDRVAVPLADLSGTLSEHFGSAPYFAFVTVDSAAQSVVDYRVSPNPHCADEHAKGIRVAEWLRSEQVDRVVTLKALEGRGPAYTLREAGIDLEQTAVHTIAELFSRTAP